MEGISIPKAKKPSKLLATTSIEQRDDLEEKIENGFNLIQNRIGSLSEKEAHDALLQLTSESKAMFETVTGGLLFGLLTDPPNAQKYFNWLSMIANDGWFCALCNVNMILFEIYPRMKFEVREQCWFFFREAIKFNVPKIDNVLINLIRNANDGSDLKEICALLNAVTNLLNSNYSWLEGLKPRASLIPVTLQTLSRFICDLSTYPQCDALRTQMITLCSWLLRERFTDCMQLGRDLVLVLLRVAKVPQFNAIWKQLLTEPNKLSPNCSGVEDLMSRPCANFQIYRVTVAMQRKMEFIMNKLKPGAYEKHIEWFRLKHLSNAEAGNLRAEAVRCATFISWPANETPPLFAHEMRAILISSLLVGANNVEAQWCKLHLFWDWLCFDPAVQGGHLLIEPGFSVMRHLLHGQPLIVNSLLDFLIRMSTDLYPQIQARVIASVTNAFKALADHNVAGSVSSVLEHVSIQKNIREAFGEKFKGLLRTSVAPHVAPTVAEKTEPTASSAEADQTAPCSDVVSLTDGVATAENAFEEEESSSAEDEDGGTCEEKITTLLAAVKEEFRDAIENLATAASSDNDVRCEKMQKLLSNIFDNDDLLDEEQIELIAECLLIIFSKHLRSRKPLPEGFAESPDVLAEVFSQPIYVLFRNLCFTPDGDATREPMLSIIAEMCLKCSSVSYLLLFFICSGRGDQSDCTTSAYTDLCRLLNRSPIQQIVSDLEQCHFDDFGLFGHLIPFVYDKFASEAMGSAELMSLLAHSLDAKQIAALAGELIRENISLFRKDTFVSIVNASLSWETTAQFIFWQLVHAECVPIDWVAQVIARLQYSKHSEAVTNIYLMMQRMEHEPNMNLLRNLLSRPSTDDFTVNCLKILIRDAEYASRMAELFATLMDRLIQAGDLLPSHLKQKRGTQRMVCLDQLFAHLDKFRQNCLSRDSHAAEKFLALPTLQDAFSAARTTEKISSLRIRYSELFAVMEILSDDSTQSSRTLRRSKPQKQKMAVENSDDEGKSKRKRQKVIDSDSE